MKRYDASSTCQTRILPTFRSAPARFVDEEGGELKWTHNAPDDWDAEPNAPDEDFPEGPMSLKGMTYAGKVRSTR